MEAVKKTIWEVTQKYQGDLKKHTLKELRRELSENGDKDISRAGAYGNVIDLECNDIQFAGKVLHSIFFTPGTDLSCVRSMLSKFFEEIKLLIWSNEPLKHSSVSGDIRTTSRIHYCQYW